ncbi:MAG: phosphoenolpyruvate synthase [DPANN group archaeon]|nr:phosphoenolpyruvate synthase [DPANN group archaeon]
MSEDKYVLWFKQIGKEDTARVGGKSANLGEMVNKVNVPVPPGFATTSEAYQHFLEYNKLKDLIKDTLTGLDTHDMRALSAAGIKVRTAIQKANMPADLEHKMLDAYKKLGVMISQLNPLVAIRSSATAEDLPGASFAGQQDTYLNVSGEKDIIQKVKDCYASLFTNRAISYRVDKGFSHFDVSLSVVFQKMVKSDTAVSGVIFTLDPDSGFDNVITITGSYGLGEYVVQGIVTPDEFIVFKPKMTIIEKKMGTKKVKLVRSKNGNVEKKISKEDSERFCITDENVSELAKYAMAIEKHYGCPMDIEWALDGDTKKIYIVQARPETVHATTDSNKLLKYVLEGEGKKLFTGLAIGRKIGTGKVNIIKDAGEIHKFKKGDVLVTKMTDPDWEPIMKIASAIITDEGGRTSHAAIVSREMGVPCVVGSEVATKILKTGNIVTVDCSAGEGDVYEGELKYRIDEKDLKTIPKTKIDVMINLGEPSQAFSLSKLPVAGVGLAREEFIILSEVKAHPMKLIADGKSELYTNALTTGIGKICAAFYPRPVIVRLSDFKTDEYATLEGGAKYEPKEDNPMIGWRGSSRYYDKDFLPAFKLECEALRRVRYEMNLDNLIIMVPFCRTIEEAKKVKVHLSNYGLDQKKGLKIFVMAEIPSNIILADKFADEFDGFSIGTNDLTQLTLGIDRNSEKMSYLYDERNEAVERSVASLITDAHKHSPRRKVGLCGQAPSDYPDFAKFLVECGIDSISVNPDVALDTILLVDKMENKLNSSKHVLHKVRSKLFKN